MFVQYKYFIQTTEVPFDSLISKQWQRTFFHERAYNSDLKRFKTPTMLSETIKELIYLKYFQRLAGRKTIWNNSLKKKLISIEKTFKVERNISELLKHSFFKERIVEQQIFCK